MLATDLNKSVGSFLDPFCIYVIHAMYCFALLCEELYKQQYYKPVNGVSTSFILNIENGILTLVVISTCPYDNTTKNDNNA